MKDTIFDLGRTRIMVSFPDYADIYSMGKTKVLDNPKEKIAHALENPVGSFSLKNLVQKKLEADSQVEAVIVISDSTRPVPYRGDKGILIPVVDTLLDAGLKAGSIKLLVATGTHRPMKDYELREFLDPRVLSLGITTVNHDCRNPGGLIRMGTAGFGGEIQINRLYAESGIKVLTGLVESHFMAGASGGRKSICPGLIAENSIHHLHSGPILKSPKARDLVIEGNPVHEGILEVARTAGCDFIVNVTLDSDFNLTGVFAGDMEDAHKEAVKKIRSYVEISVNGTYDIVVTHGGYVGLNHYQSAKGAVLAEELLNPDGFLIHTAHHSDFDPIGSKNYREQLHVLKEKGAEEYMRMILDPSWTFVPDQWEVQMWTRLFRVIPQENLLYCCFEIPEEDLARLPGTDARTLAPEASDLKELTEQALGWATNTFRERTGKEPRVAVFEDGPYGIPCLK